MLSNRADLILLTISLALFSCDRNNGNDASERHSYFLKNTGNDSNSGSRQDPWKTLEKLTNTTLHPGDSVYLQGGETFAGSLILDSGDSGNRANPVVITSYGKTSAIIDAGNSSAISVYSTSYLILTGIHIKGSGRNGGNITNGLEIKNCNQISVNNFEAEGFQKAGVLIYSSKNIIADKISSHDNGATGILISGENAKTDCYNIIVRNSRADNNPGDPTNKTNHSGNGILAGYATRVLIEYCAATNNGWDMPRTGNGPVGIWAYESDSVTIQHCIAYQNKTSKGGEDGGGFDLDGGVTNSVIQYCLSWQNQGSGYGIFQYQGASAWNNNTIRYNISENDGQVSAAKAGIYIWNGSRIATSFTNCYIYNNVIYNNTNAAIAYSPDNGREHFFFYNNILIGKNEIIRGATDTDKFIANNWLSLQDGFNAGGLSDLKSWSDQFDQEKLDGVFRGMNIDPQFKAPGIGGITSTADLISFSAYTIPEASPLRTSGVDLKSSFDLMTGAKDFNGKVAPVKGIGAQF